MNDWLYVRRHGFTLGYSREGQVITMFQGIANHLERGGGLFGHDNNRIFQRFRFTSSIGCLQNSLTQA
jgi:hypothetical protein